MTDPCYLLEWYVVRSCLNSLYLSNINFNCLRWKFQCRRVNLSQTCVVFFLWNKCIHFIYHEKFVHVFDNLSGSLKELWHTDAQFVFMRTYVAIGLKVCMYTPFHQGCGSGMIYSGSGSKFIFLFIPDPDPNLFFFYSGSGSD